MAPPLFSFYPLICILFLYVRIGLGQVVHGKSYLFGFLVFTLDTYFIVPELLYIFDRGLGDASYLVKQ